MFIVFLSNLWVLEIVAEAKNISEFFKYLIQEKLLSFSWGIIE